MGEDGNTIRTLNLAVEGNIGDRLATVSEADERELVVESTESIETAVEKLEWTDCVVVGDELPAGSESEFLETVRTAFPNLPLFRMRERDTPSETTNGQTPKVTAQIQLTETAQPFRTLANQIEGAVKQYRATERTTRLGRARRVIREVNRALLRSRDRARLKAHVTDVVADADHYAFAWIGTRHDDNEAVQPQASAGRGEGYLEQVMGTRDDDQTKRSPATKALIAESVTAVQSLGDGPDQAWRDAAVERGYQASAAVPLEVDGTTYGVLAIYSTDPRAFGEPERELLRELGTDVARGIERAEQEQRYRQLFEKSVNALAVHEVITDEDGTPVDYEFLDVNESFERLTGLDREEIRGGRATAVLPDLEPAFIDRYGSVVTEDKSIRFQHEATSLDSYYDISAFPVGDDRFVTAFEDITDRREQQRRLELLLDDMDDAVFVHPPDGSFTFVNQAAVERYGYDQDALLAMEPTDLVATEQLQRHANRLRRIQTEGQLVFETNHQTRDGEVFPAEINATYTTFSGEASIVSIIRDVSAREKARADLRALHTIATDIEAADSQAAVYELLVEAAESVLEFDVAMVDRMEDGVLVPEAVSSAISVDQYYQEMSVDSDGIAPEAYRSGESSIVDDLRTCDRTPADPQFRSVLTVPIGDFGTFQTVSEEVGAYGEWDRELTEVLTAHAREQLARLEHEQTLKEQRSELRRQNERLEEFASLVSHDLRNPLNVAELRTELAHKECDSDHLDAIDRAHDRMEALIDDLLALARERESELDLACVALDDVVEDAWQHVETRSATLVCDVASDVRADRQRLLRLLENLVRNAVEHGPTSNQAGPGDAVEHGPTSNQAEPGDAVEHGPTSNQAEPGDAVEHGPTSNQAEPGDAVEHGEADVTVTVGSLDDGFYVADDGEGIHPDRREEIFTAGFSTEDRGTGLGLAIVEQIVAAHGWGVDVTASEAGGARFEITGLDTESC